MNSAKVKIRFAVDQWEKSHPFDFQAYLAARKVKTDNLSNTFAETPGGGFILRLLYELPEDLDFTINHAIDDAELQWLRTDAGGKWFAKTFKQYNVSQKS